MARVDGQARLAAAATADKQAQLEVAVVVVVVDRPTVALAGCSFKPVRTHSGVVLRSSAPVIARCPWSRTRRSTLGPIVRARRQPRAAAAPGPPPAITRSARTPGGRFPAATAAVGPSKPVPVATSPASLAAVERARAIRSVPSPREARCWSSASTIPVERGQSRAVASPPAPGAARSAARFRLDFRSPATPARPTSAPEPHPCLG